MNSKVGFDTWKATTGTKYINVGFRPKVIFFLANHDTGNNTGSGGFEISFGITDTVTQVAFGQRSNNGLTTMVSSRYHDTDAVMTLQNSVSLLEEAKASFVSVDDNGFTINFSAVTGSEERFAYMAWGGIEFTNVLLGSVPIGAYGSTNSYDIGFRPSNLLYVSDLLPTSDDAKLCFTMSGTGMYSMFISNIEDRFFTSEVFSTNYNFGYRESLAVPAPPLYYRGYLGGVYTATSGNLATNRSTFGNTDYFPLQTTNEIYYLAMKMKGDRDSYFSNTPELFVSSNGTYTVKTKCTPKAGLFLASGIYKQTSSSTPAGAASISIGFVDEDGNQAVFFGDGYKNTVPNPDTFDTTHGQLDNYTAYVYWAGSLGRSVSFGAWGANNFTLIQDYVRTGYTISPFVGGYYIGNFIIGDSIAGGQAGIV